jgi:hypothetical protein
MSAPSRQEIRTRLRQAVRQVGQVVARAAGRFAPVGEGWSDPPPDHKVHFVLRDGVSDLCCEWHAEHAFRQATTLVVSNTHSDDPS